MYFLVSVVFVVLALTRTIKSVVTGQAPVTLEVRNAQGKTQADPKFIIVGTPNSDAVGGGGGAKT